MRDNSAAKRLHDNGDDVSSICFFNKHVQGLFFNYIEREKSHFKLTGLYSLSHCYMVVACNKQMTDVTFFFCFFQKFKMLSHYHIKFFFFIYTVQSIKIYPVNFEGFEACFKIFFIGFNTHFPCMGAGCDDTLVSPF